jgi:hypothetical protein
MVFINLDYIWSCALVHHLDGVSLRSRCLPDYGNVGAAFTRRGTRATTGWSPATGTDPP